MPKKFKEDRQDDDEFLTDLLLEGTMPLTQIAKELGISVNDLNKKINRLGLSWAKERHKKMSRGQSALTLIMKKLLPGEKIVNEYHVGEKLMLDVYCPSYKLAAEYHGRQHFFYTQRFFESKYDFEQAQKRDERKIELCKEQGIVLIVFRYNDMLTEQSVYDRMLDAIRNSEFKKDIKIKKSVTQNPLYQKAKKNNSERRKEAYRKMKEKRKNGT
jgi:very-short-patch-repair endonuclease